MRKRIATLAAIAAALALAAPASAGAAPVLELEASHAPSHGVPVGTYARYALTVSNTGTTETTEEVGVEFSVPASLEITQAEGDEFLYEGFFEIKPWDCSIAPDGLSASCTGVEPIEGFGLFPIEAGKEACEDPYFGVIPVDCRIFVTVKADESAPLGTVSPTVTACGGGDTTCPTVAATAPDDPLEIVPFDYHIESFDGRVLKQNGEPATQAGSHPHTAATEIFTSAAMSSGGSDQPIQQNKDAIVKLPPGLVGNPQAIATCTQAQLKTDGVGFQGNPTTGCPAASQVGLVVVREPTGSPIVETHGVYNMERPQGSAANRVGTPAVFAFEVGGAPIQVYAKLRTGEDYGITVINKNAPQTIPFTGIEFTFWGVPADPSHDPDRFCTGGLAPNGAQQQQGCPSEAPLVPFLSLPTSCEGTGPNNSVETGLEVLSWEGGSDTASFFSHDNEGNPIGAEGCNALDFSPTLEARPTTTVADAPSGLEVNLHIPQTEDPNGTATAHLRHTTVTLPEGLVINPSGANGLDGCSTAEYGLTSAVDEMPIHTTADPATCPDSAKLGTVEVDSPLVDHPLDGSVYIADPYDNPFGSLLAIYIALDDPDTGTVVKLAGEVRADPATGRLTTTFEENPQLPFEDFRLKFFGGAGGSLRTPALCGNYTTSSSLTPWSGNPPATPSDQWAITQGPNGGACAATDGARRHAPDLDAGTVSPIAASYSPLVVALRREDGSQQFSSVTLTPPPGLVGKLAGIPYCPPAALDAAAAKSGRAEQASPSCPAASEIGNVSVAAGAGPAPYWAHGKAYLTGPYKGAPISLAVITPATAGPFDLGTVVVRTALRVNPATAQITAEADPLPSILQGIPLDVRQILIRLDRSQFSLNGTSCDPLAFTGTLVSTLGQVAALSERFQLGECTALGFKPRMSLSLKGGTKRRAHPALTATLEPRPGDANLSAISVALPPTELLDQSRIGTVCTRVQFAASECPAAAIYGQATVSTPLLDQPLSGPVYLRSSNNPLPDLVPDLRGPASQPIKLESAGRTDTVKGALRNTFDAIPDAPFTKLVLTLPGGSKGLIQNSTNICSKAFRATINYEAQNGLTLTQRPKVKADCPKKKKHKKHRKRSSHRRAVR